MMHFGSVVEEAVVFLHGPNSVATDSVGHRRCLEGGNSDEDPEVEEAGWTRHAEDSFVEVEEAIAECCYLNSGSEAAVVVYTAGAGCP